MVGMRAGSSELGLGQVGRLLLTKGLEFALGLLGLTKPLVPSGGDQSQIQERDPRTASEAAWANFGWDSPWAGGVRSLRLQ